jgi:hypothetical protein
MPMRYFTISIYMMAICGCFNHKPQPPSFKAANQVLVSSNRYLFAHLEKMEDMDPAKVDPYYKKACAINERIIAIVNADTTSAIAVDSNLSYIVKFIANLLPGDSSKLLDQYRKDELYPAQPAVSYEQAVNRLLCIENYAIGVIDKKTEASICYFGPLNLESATFCVGDTTYICFDNARLLKSCTIESLAEVDSKTPYPVYGMQYNKNFMVLKTAKLRPGRHYIQGKLIFPENPTRKQDFFSDVVVQ